MKFLPILMVVLVFEISFVGPAETTEVERPSGTEHIRPVAGSDVRAEIDWEEVSPNKFLEYLQTRKKYLVVLDAPDDWITEEDVPVLIELIDSSKPCASAESAFAILSHSRIPPNIPLSTVGCEVIKLIEGFKEGRYPPLKDQINTGLLLKWWYGRG